MDRTKENDFSSLVLLACEKLALKKLVFSRPLPSSGANKVTGRLIRTKAGDCLSLEFSVGVTVRQKNVSGDAIMSECEALLSDFMQADLISTVGNAEYKNAKGVPVLLGADKLRRKLTALSPNVEAEIPGNDREKNHILTGSEDFLRVLGISDDRGRVHDKRQAKFRQIDRFLSHLRDIYPYLRREGKIRVYDLCCGKSYLSFAVYYFLHALYGREVEMLCVDMRDDVIESCRRIVDELGYEGMNFITGDIKECELEKYPDLVISLHACDIATDIVLERAAALCAKVILSTPCCHRNLQRHLDCAPLAFVSAYPHLSDKLCEALTDALRISRLRSEGYTVSAPELTDPDDTPKNTLIRAILRPAFRPSSDEGKRLRAEYEEALRFVTGRNTDAYLKQL